MDFSKTKLLTGVNQLGLVTSLQVMEDRSIIEISQVDHIIALLKLRRIDLTNLSGWKSFFLWKIGNKYLVVWIKQYLYQSNNYISSLLLLYSSVFKEKLLIQHLDILTKRSLQVKVGKCISKMVNMVSNLLSPN